MMILRNPNRYFTTLNASDLMKSLALYQIIMLCVISILLSQVASAQSKLTYGVTAIRNIAGKRFF